MAFPGTVPSGSVFRMQRGWRARVQVDNGDLELWEVRDGFDRDVLERRVGSALGYYSFSGTFVDFAEVVRVISNADLSYRSRYDLSFTELRLAASGLESHPVSVSIHVNGELVVNQQLTEGQDLAATLLSVNRDIPANALVLITTSLIPDGELDPPPATGPDFLVELTFS